MELLFAASGCDPDAEATVYVTDDAEVRALNHKYRDCDKPTDVLSFSMAEGEGAQFAGHELGDIFISLETAQRQAERAEHRDRVAGDEPAHWTLDDEVTFLAIHGMLHLLGFDHAEPDQERQMRDEERRIWLAIGTN
jgi:probable rRNA maturation factor